MLRAKSNLRTCLAQNDKRLTNPELFVSVRPVEKSPLRWLYKSIDLGEFLVYASECGVFGNMPFSEVVRQHEWLYNISLGSPGDLKRNVKERKIKFAGLYGNCWTMQKKSITRFSDYQVDANKIYPRGYPCG